MNDKAELTISIAQAGSLKRITKMPGWKIPEGFLSASEDKYNKQLRDNNNNDMADVKACRKILEFIADFRDLFKYTDIAADEDSKELAILKRGE